MKRKLLNFIGIGAIAAVMLAAAPAGATGGTATVNVVHGIPGVAVNVCVDGHSVADNFRYGNKIVGAQLPAGAHGVKLVAAGAPCTSSAILSKDYTLADGVNYTIVANLNASGTANLLAFGNNVRKVDAGMARLTVRHTAEAPAVNVWANGSKLIGGTSFTWSKSRKFDVPAGCYRVKVTLPGSGKAVIGPVTLRLSAGKAYQVYAVGSAGHFRLVAVATPVGTR